MKLRCSTDEKHHLSISLKDQLRSKIEYVKKVTTNARKVGKLMIVNC